MFQLDPNNRLQMVDLMNHQWMSGEIATEQEVIKEFDRRYNEINATEHVDSSEEIDERDGRKNMRSVKKEKIDEWEAQKNLPLFDPISDVSACIFSFYSPDDIEKLIVD